MPLLKTRLDKSAFDDNGAARVMFTVYVLVPPFWAVTIIVIALFPTFNGIAPDGVPLATAAPFTVIEGFPSLAVGVIEIVFTLFATDSV